MGVDLRGWVEVKDTNKYGGIIPPVGQRWHGVVKANYLADRNLDLFGMLFGISNFTNLPPVVGVRGLPPDLSLASKQDYVAWETFAQTWITWQEFKAIDWDVDGIDGRPHMYERHGDGQLVYRGKAGPREGDIIEEGRTWERGQYIYKVERISRRQIRMSLNKDWELLLDLMERLARDYGDEYVRLVAWFDQ